MHFIVFDLEWNTPLAKDRRAQLIKHALPEEITQIGAVKLACDGEILDVFEAHIRPQVYPKLNPRIRALTNQDWQWQKKEGEPFVAAYKRFIAWAGEEAVFCSWSDSDLYPLRHCLAFYHLLDQLPRSYVDLQRLFHLKMDPKENQRSLSYACAYLDIEMNQDQHHALHDAHYAASVLQAMMYRLKTTHQWIAELRQEGLVIDPLLQRKRSETIPFGHRLSALDRTLLTVPLKCPACGEILTTEDSWHRLDGPKHKYVLAGDCPKHGRVQGLIFHVVLGKDYVPNLKVRYTLIR